MSKITYIIDDTFIRSRNKFHVEEVSVNESLRDTTRHVPL